MADAKSSRGMIAVDKMGTKVLFLSTKEALVTFPDAATGAVHKLFTNREVRTAAFDLDGDELDFYDQLTRYVEDQSIAAEEDESARGRAVGFTMAMLQRRMASTVYAVRRTLERMRTDGRISPTPRVTGVSNLKRVSPTISTSLRKKSSRRLSLGLRMLLFQRTQPGFEKRLHV